MTAPRILRVGEEPPPFDPPPPKDASPSPCPADREGPKGMTTGRARKGTGERFRVLNTFVDETLAKLSRAEIAVWLVLYRVTREAKAKASYDDLARRSGTSRRHVRLALRRLEELGLIKVVRRGGRGRGSSTYRVRGAPKVVP